LIIADSETFFGRSRRWKYVVVAFLFLLGATFRLADLTDPPLDFHPMRQLRGAIISRAMYHQMSPSADPATRQLAQSLAGIMEPQEPPILERLVASIEVLLGGENLWVARVLNGLFWAVTAWLVFVLARRMTSFDGGVIALAYLCVLPFGVQTTRFFQPDALMLLGLTFTTYALFRWGERQSWTWTAAAGIAAGLTVLVKGRIALMVLVMVVAAVLATWGLWKALRRPKAWTMGLLMVAIPSTYYLLVIPMSTLAYAGGVSGAYLWISLQPWFYIRWMDVAG
jgi:4-amino-4-deoxy-L-arabinose transferase-like glycosyltransferase